MKRKYLVILWWLIVIIIIGALYFKIKNFINTSLVVKKIEISGASSGVKSTIHNKLNHFFGKKLKDVNITEVKKYIISLPWFANASIHVEYPDTLAIKVVEKNPYFLWQDDNLEYFVVDVENKLLRKALDRDFQTLILITKGRDALVQSEVIRFLIYYDFYLLEQIKELRYNGIRFDIILKNNITIKLPEDGVEKIFTKLITLHERHQIFNRNIEYIDTRVKIKMFIMPKYQKLINDL